MKLLHFCFVVALFLIFILLTHGCCLHKSQDKKFQDIVKQEYQTDKQLQEWRK